MEKDGRLTLLGKAVETMVGRRVQTPRDFEYLAQKVFDRLHENISPTTLKRLWGYLSERFVPIRHTLCFLARFVGCSDWNDFCHGRLPAVPVVDKKEYDTPEFTRDLLWWVYPMPHHTNIF